MGLRAIPAGAVCSVRAVNLNRLNLKVFSGLALIGYGLADAGTASRGMFTSDSGVNPVTGDSAGQAYLALKSSAASLVLSICETSLEFSALVHKI